MEDRCERVARLEAELNQLEVTNHQLQAHLQAAEWENVRVSQSIYSEALVSLFIQEQFNQLPIILLNFLVYVPVVTVSSELEVYK